MGSFLAKFRLEELRPPQTFFRLCGYWICDSLETRQYSAKNILVSVFSIVTPFDPRYAEQSHWVFIIRKFVPSQNLTHIYFFEYFQRGRILWRSTSNIPMTHKKFKMILFSSNSTVFVKSIFLVTRIWIVTRNVKFRNVIHNSSNAFHVNNILLQALIYISRILQIFLLVFSIFSVHPVHL